MVHVIGCLKSRAPVGAKNDQDFILRWSIFGLKLLYIQVPMLFLKSVEVMELGSGIRYS